MAIARWKAERARNHFARRIVSKTGQSLDAGARSLTKQIAAAPTDEARFRVVCGEWGFPLPTGSALLTVCYPEWFTVYDIRVCTELNAFRSLGSRTRIESLWAGYAEFVEAVRSHAPEGLSLRAADRWIWGRSRYRDLETLVNSIGNGDQLRRKS
jgi:hypothetical protein